MGGSSAGCTSGRGPCQRPIPASSARRSATSIEPSGRPIARATSDRARASVMAVESRITWPNGRARPSQSSRVPDFSVMTPTGRTTSATAVTSVDRVSSARTNGAAARASRNASGSGVSAASTPARMTAPIRRSGASAAASAGVRASAPRRSARTRGGSLRLGVIGGQRLDHSGQVQAGLGRQGVGVDAPRRGRLGAGVGVGQGSAPGEQPGQGAGLERPTLTGAAGHPGQARARGLRPGRRRPPGLPATGRRARRPG